MYDEGGCGYQLVGLALVVLSFIVVIAIIRAFVALIGQKLDYTIVVGRTGLPACPPDASTAGVRAHIAHRHWVERRGLEGFVSSVPITFA
jgi:hypothetical protein